MYFFKFMCGFIVPCFSLFCCILLYQYTTVSFSIPLLMDVFGCFWFGTLTTRAAVSIFLCLLVHEGGCSEHTLRYGTVACPEKRESKLQFWWTLGVDRSWCLGPCYIHILGWEPGSLYCSEPQALGLLMVYRRQKRRL